MNDMNENAPEATECCGGGEATAEATTEATECCGGGEEATAEATADDCGTADATGDCGDSDGDGSCDA